jgi:hypothetical protein
MATAQEQTRSEPGVGAALLAFALFLTIALGAHAVAQRRAADETWIDMPAADRPRLEAFALLSEERAGSRAKDFRDAEVAAILGECLVDLSEADLTARGGRLEFFVLFGKMRVRVPPGWTVVRDEEVILGTFTDRTEAAHADPAKRLTLEGFVLGGTIEVTH